MARLDREIALRMERRMSKLCSIDLGGPEAPTPDPAIGRAAEANAGIGREALDFSKQQWADQKAIAAKYEPYIQKVLQQQLDLGAKNAAQADDYINYMKGTFRPIEQGLANDATEFDTEAKRNELAGKAASDVEQAAELSDESARREAARYGVNTGDSNFAENLAGSSLNKTILKVGAMNQARTAARAEGRAFKFDVAGLGRNLPGAGATASSVALQAGAGAAGTATIPGTTARADSQVMNQGFNTGMAGNSSAGNLYQGVFDANMRRYGADMQAQAGMWQGLGTLGGMAGYAAIVSSRGVKVRKGKVDTEAIVEKVKKMPIERWQYKEGVADGGEHVGTYSEDFKELFGTEGDGKSIKVVDAIGVTLAAVQGLAKKVDRIENNQAARIAQKGVACPA